MAASPPDIFNCLPREILLALIKLSPGLSPLWSLIQASPSCSDLFDDCALEVIEAVMMATIPPSIQHIMRAALRCQVPALAHPTLEEARNIMRDIDKNMRRTTPLVISAPLTLAAAGVEALQDTRLTRHFLSLAHQIHILGHACVDHYIDASLSLRPCSLVRFGPRTPVYRDKFETAEGKPYQPRSTGPPSWVEEHRISKMLWLTQHFLTLQTSRVKGGLGWSTEDLHILESTRHPSDFYALQKFEKQQLLTVDEFLQTRVSGRKNGQISMKDRYRLPIDGIENTFATLCAPPLSFGPKEDHFQQSQAFVDKSPMSFVFQVMMARNPNMSPLPGMPFDPYRKFGFAIFDDRRMTDLGFAEADKKALFNFIEYHYTWFSVLTEDERNLSGGL